MRGEGLQVAQEVELVAEAAVALHAVRQVAAAPALRTALLLVLLHLLAQRVHPLQLSLTHSPNHHLLRLPPRHFRTVQHLPLLLAAQLEVRHVDVVPGGVAAVLREMAGAAAQRALVGVQDGHGALEAVLAGQVHVLLGVAHADERL